MARDAEDVELARERVGGARLPDRAEDLCLLHELSVDYALPIIFARDAFGLTFVSSACSSPCLKGICWCFACASLVYGGKKGNKQLQTTPYFNLFREYRGTSRGGTCRSAATRTARRRGPPI